MSLYSALMASVSGMSAQANALSTISDNIANADTTGYKQASTQFEDMLNEYSTSEYNAGGVATVVNYNIAQQGDPTSTSTSTNMAIEGNGFFVVENASGQTYLTLRRFVRARRERQSRQCFRLYADGLPDQLRFLAAGQLFPGSAPAGTNFHFGPFAAGRFDFWNADWQP